MASRVLGGTALMLGAQLSRRLFDFILMVVLARILTPEDFGLVALAATTILVAMALADVQLSDALVRMPDPQKHHYDTAFTLALTRSLVVYAVLLAVSWPLAWIYEDPRLQPVLAVIALAPALRSMVSPRMAVYARKISFVPEAVNEIVSKFLSFLLAVTLAIRTESYWAIVAGQVAAPFFYVTLSYLWAPFQPRLTLLAWRELISFSGWISMKNLINVLNFNIDRFLIGARLGPGALGLYVMAGNWAALATQTLQTPLSKVLFTRLAQDAHDDGRLRTSYLRAQTGAGAILMPMGLGMAMVAPYLIPLALGPGWETAIPMVQILAPLFSIQALAAPAQALAMSRGATQALFWRDVINLCVRVPLILAGVLLFGIAGVLGARIIAGLNITVMNLVLVRRLSDLSVSRQIVSMWRSLLAGAVMVVGMFALEYWMDARRDDLLIKLLVATFAGCIFYITTHFAAWAASGRPQGPETMALQALSRVASKKRKRS